MPILAIASAVVAALVIGVIGGMALALPRINF